MLDTVCFEFEGVLADTAPARRTALVRSLADDRIAVSEREIEEQFAGLVGAELINAAIARFGGDIAIDDTARELAAHRAERYFAEQMGSGVSLMPGARELVDRLAGRAKMAIVSRAKRREIESTLALAGIDGAFECVIAADDVRRQKPAADGYVRALASLARRRGFGPPPTVVALEDSAAGIAAAHAAGLRAIAVGTLPAHQALGADAYLTSLEAQTLRSLGALIGETMERAR